MFPNPADMMRPATSGKAGHLAARELQIVKNCVRLAKPTDPVETSGLTRRLAKYRWVTCLACHAASIPDDHPWVTRPALV